MKYENLNQEIKCFFDKLEIEKTPEKVAIFFELSKFISKGTINQIKEILDEEYENLN